RNRSRRSLREYFCLTLFVVCGVGKIHAESPVTVAPVQATSAHEATLFAFDDVSIPFTDNLILTMHPAQKHPANPVVALGGGASLMNGKWSTAVLCSVRRANFGCGTSRCLAKAICTHRQAGISIFGAGAWLTPKVTTASTGPSRIWASRSFGEIETTTWSGCRRGSAVTMLPCYTNRKKQTHPAVSKCWRYSQSSVSIPSQRRNRPMFRCIARTGFDGV